MSEGISLTFFLASTAVSALVLTYKSMKHASETASPQRRHLIKRQTQFTDGQLLRQILSQLGYKFQEGGDESYWGSDTAIDLTVLDADDHPWFALGKDTIQENYFVLHLDNAHPQDGFDPEERLSEQAAMPALGELAQQYAFVKSLRALLKDGYKIIEEGRRPDESRVVVLQRKDPSSGEQHQVRMVLEPLGNASILTDARRVDGEHGTCPDITGLLDSIGITEYQKWPSPSAQKAQVQSLKMQQSATAEMLQSYSQDVKQQSEEL